MSGTVQWFNGLWLLVITALVLAAALGLFKV